MAQITPDDFNAQGKIEASQFISPEQVEKEAALQLTVQDTQRTENYLQANYWSLRWREAQYLYQSPPSIQTWEGTTVPRSNVNPFVVGQVVNSILPQVMNGLFYESPAFVLRPRPNVTQNTTRAITELLAVEIQLMNVRQEIEWGIHGALLFGTAIWKWGFKSETRKRTKYTPIGNAVQVPSAIPGQPASEIATPDSLMFKKEVTDEEYHLPTFEFRDIRHVLVDPGARVPDIRKAKFVIDRMYLTYRDLIKLADEEYVDVDPVTKKQTLKKTYDLPDEATIKSWFEPPIEQPVQPGNSSTTAFQNTAYIQQAEAPFKKTTEDPLNEPLEVLERWDNDKVITVLNRKKLIRNQPNEFGKIPFLSVNWWNIQDAFWGLGLGRVIGVEQRVQAGIINACLDLTSLIVNPMFVRARGANIQEQQIRQRIGGIITVDGPVKEAFTLLEQPSIPGEVLQQLSLSDARAQKEAGASDPFISGANGSRAGAARSGTGAAGMIQATMTRIGGFAEMFVKQVYEPLLYQIHELNKDKMPMGYIKQILGEQMGPDFKFDDGSKFKFNAQEYLDAPAEFEVLAGSHLAAKAQMAQSLFMMIQLFESAPLMDQLSKVSHEKIDIGELFRMVCDVSGWKNTYDIIKKMSPQEIQNLQQQNPAVMKVQGQMAVNNQKFGQQQQLIDQENEARVVRDILRHIAEKSSEPEALLGAEQPEEGLGSNEAG